MITKFRFDDWVNKGAAIAGITFETTILYEENVRITVVINRQKVNPSHYILLNKDGNFSIKFKESAPFNGETFIIYKVPPFNPRNKDLLSPKKLQDFYDGVIRWVQAMTSILSVFQRTELKDIEEELEEGEVRIIKTPVQIRTVTPRVGTPTVQTPQTPLIPDTEPPPPDVELPPLIPNVPTITIIPDPPDPPDIPETTDYRSKSTKAYVYLGNVVDSRGNPIEDISSLDESSLNNLFNNLYLKGTGTISDIDAGRNATDFFNRSEIDRFRSEVRLGSRSKAIDSLNYGNAFFVLNVSFYTPRFLSPWRGGRVIVSGG